MTRPSIYDAPLTPRAPFALRHPRLWGLAAALTYRAAAWAMRWER